jgi:hypothetical protein
MSELSDALLKKYRDKLPEEYIVAIANMAEGHINRRFLNDSKDHASLLIDSMIVRSKTDDEVRIYSGSLRADCFREVLLSGNQKIRILVDDMSAAQSAIDGINKQNNNIKILPAAQKWTNHFFTVGDSFRYELDDGKAAASANFNEPAIVEKLNARFDAMWLAAEQKAK